MTTNHSVVSAVIDELMVYTGVKKRATEFLIQQELDTCIHTHTHTHIYIYIYI